MRGALIFLAILSALTSAAFDFWYDKPKEMPAGITILGDAEGKTVLEGVLQVRGSSPGDKSPWGIIWGMTDSLNFTRARLTVPADNKFDDNFGSWYGLCVERVDSGLSTTLIEILPGMLKSCDRGENTLKLIFDDPAHRSARLYAGKKDLTYIGAVPFGAGKFALWTGSERVKATRTCLELDTISPPPTSRFYSPAVTILPDTDHPAAGQWEFLDRDIKRGGISLGGEYRLAVVPDNAGGYEIVYAGCRGAEPANWRSGMVKGRLAPTDFEGDYDMEWYDTSGRLHSSELNASLNPEGNLLTLNFPIWQATLRFRRVSRR